MFSALTPSKIDKSQRFRGTKASARKQTSGKGDVRSSRITMEAIRKRKRHNRDRDVGSFHHAESDFSGDEEAESYGGRGRGPRDPQMGGQQPSFWRGFMENLQDFEHAPIHLWNWFVFTFRVVAIIGSSCIGMSAVYWFITDVYNVIDADIETKKADASVCEVNYLRNECAKDRLLPALEPLCNDWFECMHQDTGSTQKVKAIVKATTDLLNEASGNLSLKSYVSYKILAHKRELY